MMDSASSAASVSKPQSANCARALVKPFARPDLRPPQHGIGVDADTRIGPFQRQTAGKVDFGGFGGAIGAGIGAGG